MLLLLAHSIVNPICAVNYTSQKIIFANKAFCTYLGYSNNQLTNTNINLLIDDNTCFKAIEHRLELTVTLSLIHKNDMMKTANWKLTNACIDKSKIIFMQKLSTQQQNHNNFSNIQKIEALATLSSGIAHDFNNILGSIIGFSELALDSAGHDEELIDDITQVKIAANRAKVLIKNLQDFTGNSNKHKLVELNLSKLLNGLTSKIKNLATDNIDLKFKISESDDLVYAEPELIERLVNILCVNAFDAIGSKQGKLEIALSYKFFEDDFIIRTTKLLQGRYAIITITDDGKGIDPKNILRIFDPYFTTKPKPENSGLGLSIAVGIVKAFKGAIKVKQNNETVFTIFVPVCKNENTVIENVNKKSILLVDDEEMLLKMRTKMLSNIGYTVTPFASSIEAYNEFEKNSYSYDILITDNTMPGLNGIDLAKKVSRLNNNVTVILCSGYDLEFSASELAEAGVSMILEKPIDKEKLVNILKNIGLHQ